MFVMSVAGEVQVSLMGGLRHWQARSPQVGADLLEVEGLDGVEQAMINARTRARSRPFT